MGKERTLLLMIWPAAFAFNPETAGNNTFQRAPQADALERVQARVQEEFGRLVETLHSEKLNILVFEDQPIPPKPDAVFPNNWLATMPGGEMLLFPIYAPLRRKERRSDIINLLMKRYPFKKLTDLSSFENEDRFLEGTGSMVFDHAAKIAYACRSKRTDEALFIDFCRQRGYRPMIFSAKEPEGHDIYHTNVMMSIGKGMALVCFESMPIREERKKLRSSLTKSGKELIDVSLRQMQNFACNALEVDNMEGRSLLLMSSRAYGSLDAAQRQQIEAHARIIHSDIPNIEHVGGGSVRCMLAELHLPSA